jgi:hypothetical protein
MEKRERRYLSSWIAEALQDFIFFHKTSSVLKNINNYAREIVMACRKFTQSTLVI